MTIKVRYLALFLVLALLTTAFFSCAPVTPSEDTNGGADSSAGSDTSDGEGDTSKPEETPASGTSITSGVMPSVYITTDDDENSWATRYQRSDKLAGLIEYTDAIINVEDCAEEYEIVDALAEVKVRGNYTLNYDKKPIRIKFKEKTGMLGLHDGEAYKNWVLLAEWKDPSLLRNALTFYLGNAILGEDGYYCSDFEYVEVYLNGEYWGVYLLVEQQEVKDGRTSVPEVEKGYTGTDIGYFFEYDGYYDEEAAMPDGDPTFEMKYGGGRDGARGYTIKSDIYSDAQVDFLRGYMNNLYTIVYRAIYEDRYFEFNDDMTGLVSAACYENAMEAVASVIDLDSLVDTYILNEIACDLDVDFSSFYLSLDLTEDGAGLLVFEAPWDFDSAYGIWRRMCTDARGLYAMKRGNPWFKLFEGVDWFEALVKERWAEIRACGVLDGALSMIETKTELYREYYIENHERWRKRLDEGHYGNLIPLLEQFDDPATAQAIAADHLSDWLTRRIEYLDGVWAKE